MIVQCGIIGSTRQAWAKLCGVSCSIAGWIVQSSLNQCLYTWKGKFLLRAHNLNSHIYMPGLWEASLKHLVEIVRILWKKGQMYIWFEWLNRNQQTSVLLLTRFTVNVYNWGCFNYHPNDPSLPPPTHCCCLAPALCNTFMARARGHGYNRWRQSDGLNVDPVITTLTRSAHLTTDAFNKSENWSNCASTEIPSLGTSNHKNTEAEQKGTAQLVCSQVLSCALLSHLWIISTSLWGNNTCLISAARVS